ncbi:MAG: DUF4132 domain-containing protein [Planctomycetota bacterium]
MPETHTRSFRYVDATSDKFWTITLDGEAHTVHFGRSGSAGQTKTKGFDTSAQALASFTKLIAQKQKKGYVEDHAAGAPPSEPTSPKPKAAQPQAAKAKAKGKAAQPQAPEAKVAGRKAQATPATAPPAERKAASAKAKPAAVDPSVEFEPRLDLSQETAFWPLWQDPEPLQRPAPQPFDREATLASLTEDYAGHRGFFVGALSWRALEPPLTPEGARFVYAVLRRVNGERTPIQVAAEVGDGQDVDLATVAGDLTLDRSWDRLVWPSSALGDVSALRLTRQFLTEQELDDLLLERLRTSPSWRAPTRRNFGDMGLREAYQQEVLPYLSRAERGRMRAQILADLAGLDLHAVDDEERWPLVLYFAALFGCVEPLQALFAAFPPGRFRGAYVAYAQDPQALLFALGSAERMVAEAERLKLLVTDPKQLAAWIATTGSAGYPTLTQSLLVQTTDSLPRYLELLRGVRDPELVPTILALRSKRSALPFVTQWFEENPGVAARGLIRALARGEAVDDARETLLDLAEAAPATVQRALELEDPAPAIAEQVAGLLEPAADVPPADLPAELERAFEAVAGLAPLKGKHAATWLRPERLEAPRVGGAPLNAAQVALALRALREVGADGRDAVAALKTAASAESLEAFAWSAYSAWERNGAPPQQKWVLAGLGHLGGDATVARLTPLIRAWPGESQHARAVLGLDCLRTIGSERALSALAGIAQKLKFRALKQRAAECMDEIAAARGLSREELADRLVPDCGLDAEGQRSFDYGPRSFAFCLGPELVPLVKRADGKLLKTPPKPGKQDDPELAPQALAEWRAFKKEVQGVLALQRERLEQAMVGQRRWSPDDFRALIVEHPLLRHLASGTVWATYGPEGPVPFRLDDAGGARDLTGKPRVLDDPVGVLHPLDLEDEERATWQALWDREGRLAPFPQLEREAISLDPQELQGQRLTHACGVPIPPQSLRGLLATRGWQRGEPQDAGIVGEHYKHFEGAGLTAVLQHGGLSVVPFEWEEDQPVDGVLFLEGALSPGECASLQADAGIPLADLDRTVLSEVARDLASIAEKRRG